MKKYEDFYNEIYQQDWLYENVTVVTAEERAAKEYAKQWVEKAATIGRMYAGVNLQNAIEDLKSKIDAQ